MFFNVLMAGFQTWTIPVSGKYKITVRGAGNRLAGTLGASIVSKFDLPAGVKLQIDAVFYRRVPLLYHKFGNMVFFLSANLNSLSSPGNHSENYSFFSAKFDNQKCILSLTISRFITM